MRIVVATGLNTGAAEYKNMGDVAMLQVAVARLLSLGPDVQVYVLTDSASDLARYCPDAKALPRAGCALRVENRVLLGRFHRFLPKWASTQLSDLKRSVGLLWPGLIELLIRLRLSIRDRNGRRRGFRSFLDVFKTSDLLVVSGSGGFADSCLEWNLSILATIEVALSRGIPVVMFGQGMGPLSDPEVLLKAKDVLPRVQLISLRGGRGGLSLLQSLGVPSAKVLTTGDEAVELAYRGHAKASGSAVGINLRVAAYSEVKTDTVEKVRLVVQEFARRHSAPLLPIPIAFHEYANDHETIRQLLKGFDDESDGGLSLDSPLSLIEQVSRCRIVVTGAYHAAVFALAQGIPAVCLSNSAYYLAKFQGLNDLFEGGCAIVMLDEPDFPRMLEAALESTWNSAVDLRSPLLESARRQVEESVGAYQQVGDLIWPERRGTHPVMPEKELTQSTSI